MFSWSIYRQGLSVAAIAACVAWLISIKLPDVSIVDSLWSLIFLLLAWCFAACPDIGALDAS